MHRIAVILLVFIILTGCTKPESIDKGAMPEIQHDKKQTSYSIDGKPIPEKVVSHFNQANEYLRNSDYENAIQRYNLVLSLQPDFAVAHYNLGVALYQTNRVPLAIEQWQKTLEYDTDYAKAYLSLGYAYEKVHDNDKAVENYDKYLQLNPDDDNAALINQKINALRGQLRGEGIIGKVSITEKVDPKTFDPIQYKDIFYDSTSVILATAEVINAPPKTNIKAVWYYQGLKGEEILVNSKEKVLEGSHKVVFKIQKPPSMPWPTGRYELRLFVDGKENLSIPFTILKGMSKQDA